MARARLTIDLGAIQDNWRALDAMTACETGAVVKADAYGLGAAQVGPALKAAGAKSFFVALAEEGVALRAAIGPGPRIFVFSGLMPGDAEPIRESALIPLLNSPGQLAESKRIAAESETALTIGFQLDSGMNRLGFEGAELAEALSAPDALDGLDVALVMSHLACADEPQHPLNRAQNAAFREISAHPGLAAAPKSIAATGGVLLGARYHHDITRPGVGLYGGMPFEGARPVVTLEVPIIQTRDIAPGEIVGYGAAYQARAPRHIATISAGYADGLIRQMSKGFTAGLDGATLHSVGRVSMDLITLDATGVEAAQEGALVALLDETRTVDALAACAGTIGYEILTSLGLRYERRYRNL
ncbi:MAG: alanine racemase [Pikeienuella sp.]